MKSCRLAPEPYLNFDQAYHELVQNVLTGEVRYPRGFTCREIRPAAFSLMHPYYGLYRGASRRLNYRFLAVEALSYLAGWGDRRHAELLCAVNSKMQSFVNPETGSFDGAYGPQLKAGLAGVVDALSAPNGQDTRQAHASIWAPGPFGQSLDVPCTLGLSAFRQAIDDPHQGLALVATMRSNDLWLGTPYDVAAFCSVQLALARCLGLLAGRYYHVAHSLHLYLNPAMAPGDQPWDRLLTPSAERWAQVHLPDPGERLVEQYRVGTRAPCLWQEVVAGADQVLEDLLKWVRDDASQGIKTLTKFVAQRELGDTPLTPYWRQWGALIRHSWQGWEASQ